MEISSRLSLIQDIDTRWNSAYYMIQRFVYLKPAISATLFEMDLDIEFSSAEWTLCDKIVTCLKYFEEDTSCYLQKRHQSVKIFPSFYNHTCIRNNNRRSWNEGMKNRLKSAMIERFRDIENRKHYSLSCLLDPRYKIYLHKDK